MNPISEIFKAHALVAQKKLSAADYDALILGTVAEEMKALQENHRRAHTGFVWQCQHCADAWRNLTERVKP